MSQSTIWGKTTEQHREGWFLNPGSLLFNEAFAHFNIIFQGMGGILNLLDIRKEFSSKNVTLYCVSEKQLTLLYSKLLYKIGHYFWDTQYIMSKKSGLIFTVPMSKKYCPCIHTCSITLALKLTKTIIQFKRINNARR